MELQEAIEGRRSIRRYTDDDVPNEDLIKILRAAGLAPSAGNQQMWHFVVIKNRQLIERMKQAVLEAVDAMSQWPEAEAYQSNIHALRTYAIFFANAPVVIAALAKPYLTPLDSELLPKHGLSFQEIHALRGDPGRQSLGAAIQNLVLAAHSLGYGTCWMTGPLFANPALRVLLDVKPEWQLAAIIPLGRPAEKPNPRTRQPVEEIYTLIE